MVYPDSPNNNPNNNPSKNPANNPNPPLVRLQLDKLLVLENSSGKLQNSLQKHSSHYKQSEVNNQSIKIGRIPSNKKMCSKSIKF